MLSDNSLQVGLANLTGSKTLQNDKDASTSSNRSTMTMDSIKAYILAHGLTPGSLLPTEAALCAELGVSRSSVREAMRRLEALDIVRSQRGSGSYVGDMSMRPLVETLVLRSALDVKGGASSLSEVIAIRKALDLGIGAELVAAMKGTKNPELEKLVTSMREHAEAGHTYYDDDIAFHSTLIKQLHNTMLEQLISAMWLIHQTVTPSLHPADHEAMLLTARAHGDILRACEEGDLKGYAAAVEFHYAPLSKLISDSE
ncbi:GntR family transcriptional regulator [Schaalia cardiffensis]|uniref:FadR/GntR family transcriptional regulator n=1 Tax=Schaalia cardiffensis TaxID=181487 RepID=UPI002AB0FF08|nr:GntR family transcriptional regulator [Schaalia cardiffensis]